RFRVGRSGPDPRPTGESLSVDAVVNQLRGNALQDDLGFPAAGLSGRLFWLTLFDDYISAAGIIGIDDPIKTCASGDNCINHNWFPGAMFPTRLPTPRPGSRSFPTGHRLSP